LMSNFQQQPVSLNSIPPVTDDEFYSVIDRLKLQGALPKETFVKEIPFFTFNNITKEA